MPKGYAIFIESIHDQDGIAAYTQKAGGTLGGHSVTPLVVQNDPEVIEGDSKANKVIVLEFESVEAARAWYHSPEYQEAKKLRDAAADSHAVIVSGLG